MSDAQILSQLDEYRALVSDRVDEPVEAACVLSRRGMMTEKMAGHFGLLTWLLTKKAFAAKAGGLPEVFLLAITPARVHAFAYKPRKGVVGDEVAAWDRSTVQVAWRDGGPMMLDVDLGAGGESYDVRVGDAPASRAFLRLLAPPLAQAA